MAKKSEFDPWTEREKLYNEINRKRWSKAKNLGKGEGVPEGWTLCDIGPQNAYIELDEKAIRKIDDDIKGFWKNVCSLITSRNLEYIFTNTEVYHDFLIRGALLYYGKSEKYFFLFIKPKLRTINKKLKKWLEDQRYFVNDQLYEGYENINEIISILEKDFFRIKGRIESYYKTCLQNSLINSLKNKKKEPLTSEKDLHYLDDIEKKQILCVPKNKEPETELLQKELKDIINKVYQGLTHRQKIIFDGLMDGLKQKQIAENLKISEKTVWREKVIILDEILKH